MLVLDANILMRAPAAAFDEARRRLPEVIERRKLREEPFMEHFDSPEAIARQRISHRDEDDWPILATALALGCPIWTEDTDFFGCGVANWTTDRVELYLAEAAS